jgi:hypothetical protein
LFRQFGPLLSRCPANLGSRFEQLLDPLDVLLEGNY